MKTPERIGFLFLLSFITIVPFCAHASMRITELMYDTVGAKAGREWVEVVNDTEQIVDLKNWKLFQGTSNHGLTLVQGSAVLPIQGVAIIAADANKFKMDWPNYTGTLFRSAFTLSNRGTSVILKNATLTVVDTASYTPDMGALGDGNSLHRSGEVFVAGAPDPGIVSGIPAPVSQPKVSTIKKPVATSVQKITPTTKSATNNIANTSARHTPVAAVRESGVTTPLMGSLIALAALIVLGVAGVWYARPTETSKLEDEFDIE